MRFISKIPKLGDVRVREGFLWFPKTVRYNRMNETRWLCKAKWIEQSIWQPIEWMS